MIMRTKNANKNRILIFINCICVIFMLALTIILYNEKTDITSISQLREIYGKYSLESALSEKKEIYITGLTICFGIISFYFILNQIYLLRAKSVKLIVNIVQSIFVVIICITLSLVLSNMYFKRPRVKIIDKSELKFDPNEIYGKEIVFTDDFQDNVYNLYSESAEAYNKLYIDGDYQSFFNSIKNSKHLSNYLQYTEELLAFQDGENIMPKCIVSNCEPGQIPVQSVYNPAKELENISYYKKNKALLVFEMIEKLNVMMDIFYGEELINIEKPNYAEIVYEGDYERIHESDFVIYDMNIDENRNGSVKFQYLGTEYTQKVINGRVFFKYNLGFRMFHIVRSDIILNDTMAKRLTPI